MILLDTNVIAELMRIQPDDRVVDWTDRQPPESLFLSGITVDEIRFGIELLPPGRRRERLTRVFSRICALFSERTLVFDAAAAAKSAAFRAARQRMGQPMGLADAQIAGVASSNAMALATLNLKDFRDIALPLREPR